MAGVAKIAPEENTTQTPVTQTNLENTSAASKTTTTANPQSSSASPKSSTTGNPVQKKKTTRKEASEELTLIQTGIEECGPEGHRDSFGICNYDVPSLNP